MAPIQRTMHDVYPFISPTSGLKDAAKGKTVLVTGGSRGIGRGIARSFALAGASKIYLVGRGMESLRHAMEHIQLALDERSADCSVVIIAADLMDETHVAKLFGQRMEKVPDVLVNNAGVLGSQKRIVDSEPGTWWRDWEMNVKSLYLCTRAYLRALNGKPGVILNVSTGVSDIISPNMSSYGGSKMAVNRFTEQVHAEHSHQGVQCIAFSPGGVKDSGLGQMVPEQFRHNLNDTVDLAGGTAVYLSTSRASYLAGRYVYANWDMEEMEGIKGQIEKDNMLISRLRFGDVFNGTAVKP